MAGNSSAEHYDIVNNNPIPVPNSSSAPFNTLLMGRTPFGSFANPAPLAEAALAADIEEEPDRFQVERSPSDSDEEQLVASALIPHHAMIGSYRRPSSVAAGPRPTVLQSTLLPENLYLTREERDRVREEERSLLRDNAVIPPKHTQQRLKEQESEDGIASRLGKRISIATLRVPKTIPDEERAANGGDENGVHTETTALLGRDPSQPYGGEASPRNITRKWEEAVTAGIIHTTWQREAKVLVSYSAPLILTFILQYSLTMASIFVVGHLGKIELGAVSLATSMCTQSPNI